MNWIASIRLPIRISGAEYEATLERLQSTLTKQQELELYRELRDRRVSRYSMDLLLRTYTQILIEGNPALCRGVRAYDVRFQKHLVPREFLLPQ